jgi:beta-mannosidase
VTDGGDERRALSDGWELARTPPGACPGVEGLPALAWVPAQVPGTAAGALSAEGMRGEIDFDAEDWWFRTRFDAIAAGAGEEVVLHIGGLATIAEVYLNGRRVLDSESMFASHEIDVSSLPGGRNELAICCRALAPRLAQRRRPRARWRTRLVSSPNLRFYRTMLLGRAPGFAPGPAVVGPWRPVALQRRRGVVLEGLRVHARVAAGGRDGVVECAARLRALPGAELPATVAVEVQGPTGRVTASLPVGADAALAGSVIVPAPAWWWPHTHGCPALYDVSITPPGGAPVRRRVGFRELRGAADLAADGLDLHVNGIAVFARGAVWTPLDLRAPHAEEPRLRPVLERLAGAGMNMLRIPGIGAYESDAFYDLCDELGILVWQDFMFANLDYPEQDPDFMATVAREARAVIGALGHRPCLAAVCGGSEVAQQVAMLGLDPALAQGPLYGELLPGALADAAVDVPYFPSAPWGGDLPFRPGRGIANYYGVGAYLRPTDDARRAGVRFASECLALANVPDDDALAALRAPGGLSVTHSAWKAGVPRDVGAGWDFDDVRDHYLALLFGVDPIALRSIDQERYLELSRAVSGELMAEVLGEWRRAASPCAGALVLWSKDLLPGAGWGVLDHRGEPKVALHHLRRVQAPVAVWTTDEGLGGVLAHVANDGPEPLMARLRVALYRDFAVRMQEATRELSLPAHTCAEYNLEAVLGRFVDIAWAYRFGPAAQDLVAVSVERDRDGATELLSQAFRCPAGRPTAVRTADELGLSARLQTGAGGELAVRVASARFADGVRVSVSGHVPADDAFGVEPGHERVVALAPAAPGDPRARSDPPAAGTGVLTALNLAGRARIAPLGAEPATS